MAVSLSAICAGRPLPARRFLVLISVKRPSRPRALVRLEGLRRPIEKYSDLIGNRTRDLPACLFVQCINFDTYLTQLTKRMYNTFVMSAVMCYRYRCGWHTVKLSGCSNNGTIRATLAQVQGHPISSHQLPGFSPYTCSQRITYE
jgi:hypothetical protein